MSSQTKHCLGVLTRPEAVLIGALALAVLVARPASVHGIGGDAATASIPGFVGIGIEHMLLGWDHLLFAAGIVLLTASARRGAKVISAFVVGHSLTLITATLAGWQIIAVLVDVVIVLSVPFVGGYGMFGRPQRFDVFTAMVFGSDSSTGLAFRPASRRSVSPTTAWCGDSSPSASASRSGS